MKLVFQVNNNETIRNGTSGNGLSNQLASYMYIIHMCESYSTHGSFCLSVCHNFWAIATTLSHVKNMLYEMQSCYYDIKITLFMVKNVAGLLLFLLCKAAQLSIHQLRQPISATASNSFLCSLHEVVCRVYWRFLLFFITTLGTKFFSLSWDLETFLCTRYSY